MKKQYLAAAACLLVGAMGLGGLYAYQNMQQKKNPQGENQVADKTEDPADEGGGQLVGKGDPAESEGMGDQDPEPGLDGSQVANKDPQPEEKEDDGNSNPSKDPQGSTKPDGSAGENTTVGTLKPETLHFAPEKGLMWPAQGPTLLEYSMDATIFYPTLQQYQYNPAMVIGAKVNDKVYFFARGKITAIETNEVTGCTVTQDLGDGYTAVYGQLKELNFKVGDMVESGQVVGYVSEPTKYFSKEGPNVYFKLMKDNVPIDPESLLEQE